MYINLKITVKTLMVMFWVESNLSNLPYRLVRSSVLQERPEEHCSVREMESYHNSSHYAELEDCFKLYTKDEKVTGTN